MSPGRLVGKLLRLSPAEWADLFRAQFAIARASWKVRTVKLGEMVEKASAEARAARGSEAVNVRQESPESQRAEPQSVKTPIPERVRELETALVRAADHGLLRPQCLVRSIALRDLLAAHGYSNTEIRVGVRHNGKEFQAHAWLEMHGTVLGDQPSHIRTFVRFDRLALRDLQ